MSDVYVATTGSDTTGDGTIGNPYRTAQKGVDGLAAQGPGNTLYFRGGEYTTIPIWQGESNKRGIDTSGLTGATSWSNSYTIRSYPGEWAVFDLSGLTESYISCFRGDDQPGQQGYIEYSHMEIKDGYGIDGCGGIIIRGGPYKLRFLHIHDNTAANGGGNPAGIILSGATGGSVVEYCYLSGNGCANRLAYNENGANLAIFSDYLYTDSCTVDTFGSQALTNANGYATARWGNIVRYNYMDGGNATIKTGVGLKNKAIQFLATDTRGLAEPVDVNSWYDKGDEYHHNIIINHEYDAMYIKNDFGQVHHNIIDQTDASSSEESRRGIENGLSGKKFRGPWKPVTYNNTVIGTHGFAIGYHGAPQCSGRDALYSIYYTYNNIVAKNTYYDNKALICFDRLSSSTYSSLGSPPWDINNRLFTEDNYYYDCSTSVTQILASLYTLTELNALGNTSGTITHDDSSSLFVGSTGADQFKLNPAYTDYTNVLDGRGGSHPYLSGVDIPSYRGAVNPDDDAWVGGVLTDLANTTYLRSQEEDPSWVEGAAPAPITTFYVDRNHPSASDSNPGTEALPFATIQKAADVVSAGETVLVKTGVYGEWVDVKSSGASANPITFKAYPGDSPVIDGTGVNVPAYDGLFHAENRSYIILDGFEVRDTDEYLIKLKTCTNCIVRNCTVHNNAGVYRSGIHLAYGSNNTIEDSEVYNTGRNAINCESSGGNNFTDNYIHSNPAHNGINIFPKTDEIPQQLYSNNNITGNRITGCTHGIYLRYQTGQLIANNIIYENSAPGINFQTHLDDAYDYDANTLILNNTIVGNSGDAIENLNARNLTIKNNIIAFNGTKLLDFDSSVLVGHDIDYNVYYVTSFLVEWGGSSYSSLAAWQSGSGHDSNSFWSDPNFVDRIGNNYRLNSSSPALDTGIDLSSAGVVSAIDGVSRPQGMAFDIGAYESERTVPIFYVDRDHPSASDSNSGTEAAPWEHCPGMEGWTGSATLSPGDTVYFRNEGVWTGTSGYALLQVPGGVTFDGSSWGEGTRATLTAGYNFDRSVVNLIEDDATHDTVVRGFNININGRETSGIAVNWPFASATLDGAIKRISDCVVHDMSTADGLIAYGIKVGAVNDYETHNTEVLDCEVYNTARTGIVVYPAITSNANKVVNCLVRGCNVYNSGDRTGITSGGNGIGIKNNVINCTVEGCQFHDSYGRGVSIDNSTGIAAPTGLVLKNNKIYSNGKGGIYFEHDSDRSVDIFGNEIFDNLANGGSGGSGIHFEANNGGNFAVRISNNTIHSNAEGSILIDPSSVNFTSLEIRNNIMYSPDGKYSLYDRMGNSITSHSNNLFFRSDGGSLVRNDAVTYDSTNINSWEPTAVSSDPLFVDIGASDYRLTESSPAVNSGADLSSLGITVDIDGTLRPQGAVFDIGAYEYIEVAVKPTGQVTSNPSPVSNEITQAQVTGTAQAPTGRTISNVAMVSGSGSVSGTTSWIATCDDLAVGVNNFTVRITDSGGGYVDVGFSVTREAALPAPTGLVTNNPSPISNELTSVQVLGTASATSPLTIVSVELIEGYGLASGTDSWSVNCTNLEVGSNSFTVKITDSAGSFINLGFTVVREEPAALPGPTGQVLENPSPVSYLETSARIEGAASATSPRTITGVSLTSGYGAISGTNSWTAICTNLKVGLNSFTVTIVDSAGEYADVHFTIERLADGAPPSTGSGVTASRGFTLTGGILS